MSSGITLSAATRQNLLSLQGTADLLSTTQTRLATGKKVNSALDNPSNFFTASGLNNRASSLSSLLDSMSNGIKTLEAADNGAKAITKTIESMQANVRQARQDKSFKGESLSLDATTIGTASAKNLAISGGSVTGSVNVALNTAAVTGVSATATGTGGFTATGTTLGGSPAAITIQAAGLNGGTAVSIGTLATGDTAANAVTKINTALNAATGGNGGITATVSGGQIVLTGTSGNNITLGGDSTTLTNAGFAAGNRASTNGVVAVTGAVKTVDEMVAAIGSNNALTGKVRATNDGGKLRIENLSTEALTLTGVGASSGQVDGSSGTKSVGGNDVRKNLITQFNELRTQLDKLAGDASYNGINLLRADKLKITFNEQGTSNIEIQAKDVAGTVRSISTGADSLNLGAATSAEFGDDTSLDSRLDSLSTALTTLQTQSSSFGAALSTVQTRQDFTKNMITTLQSGADSLVNADMNEEGATLLALNTRAQLSQTSLSLASQSDQSVLRLF